MNKNLKIGLALALVAGGIYLLTKKKEEKATEEKKSYTGEVGKRMRFAGTEAKASKFNASGNPKTFFKPRQTKW